MAAGMSNVPGSKPTLVPMGSQVQMASPWAANNPAWMAPTSGQPFVGMGNDIATPPPSKPQQATPTWRQPMIPMGLLSPLLMPGMQQQQQQAAAAAQPAVTAPAATTPAPATPAAPTAPTQSAANTAIGSAIDPSVMAGLSAADRANYQIDPSSGTWIRVR